tara:strand:+ start:4806 stop:5510 length:705 start_codon:yes stop_codon:yes gene_type:complete
MISKNLSQKNLYKFSTFKKIINFLLNEGYTFETFKKKKFKSNKTIFLRHDIDLDPNYLKLFLNFYEEKKIKCNIFIMLNSNTYNIFDEDNIKFINDIAKKHLIGFHLDSNITKNKDALSTVSFIKKYIKLSNSVSFHRPSQNDLKKGLSKKIINTYSEKFTGKNFTSYVSDSGQKKNFHIKLIKLVKTNNPIQLLIHPVWWQNISDRKRIKKKIIKDQKNKIQIYLKKNFSNKL